ncbi:hypothetical protein GCM10025734_31580 [Kitasatospora paranensis]
MHGAHPYDEAAGRSGLHASALRAEKVLPTMSTAALPALAKLAEGGNHDSLNPFVTGGSALFILLLLAFITTRFNRDR